MKYAERGIRKGHQKGAGLCHLLEPLLVGGVARPDAFFVEQCNNAASLLVDHITDDLVVEVLDRCPLDALGHIPEKLKLTINGIG